MSYRDRAVRLVQEVVPCDNGDARFHLMTGGKFQEGFGSTCGYLCHYVLWCLFREARIPPGDERLQILNRDDPELGTRYGIGENVSRLVAGAKAIGAWQDRSTRDSNGGSVLWDAQPGDLIFCSNGPARSEHVFVFLSTDQKTWNSADAGQVNNAGHQAARFKTRALTPDLESLEFLGGARQIQGFVNLDWLGLDALGTTPGDAPSSAGDLVPVLLVGAFAWGLWGSR